MSRNTFHRGARATAPRRLFAPALFAALCLAAVAAGARDASAQTPVSPDLVISQVYTRGGEPGATFRNDFVEIFNRGNATVNLADYSLQVLVNVTPPGGTTPISTPVTIRFVSTGGGFPVAPGKYVLYQFGSSGNNGAPLPVTPEAPAGANNFNLPSGAGRVALVKGMAFHPYAQYGCGVGADAALADFFAYGPSTCVEGDANFPAPSPTTAALRNQDGCADTNSNAADFATAAPLPRNSTAAAHLCNLTPLASTVQFEVASATVNEGAGFAEIFVTRTGSSGVAKFQYATGDDTASERSDYTTTLGVATFAQDETRTSFRIPITDDARQEGTETLFVSLNLQPFFPSGLSLGATHVMRLSINDNDAAPSGSNPIDSTDFFVRQHYADFLSREPDAPGFQFWTNEIEQCGADAQCREVKRINVSAAFFLAIEFQETGYFAYRAYKAAFPDNPSRLRGFPLYRELWRDAQVIAGGVIVGQGDWQQQLTANKAAYAVDFTLRPEFQLRYPDSMTPEAFVDALNANTGGALSPAERDAEVALLKSGPGMRGLVFRHVVEDPDFKRTETNRAFVLMEYFGYLRRNPFDPPEPTLSFAGYDFWLSKLDEFGGNFVRAEMVKAFISSDEYRRRFAQ
ncbi:MAG TPA: Calx-beta domain-containing protein [Pyrinomonadaceae bacterium]|jgi:hypothetical protein